MNYTTTAIYGAKGITKQEQTPFDRPYDGYKHLELGIRKSFEEAVDLDKPFFTTSATDLYDIFLANLPEEGRQHYNCNACRNFVNHYGGIVVINDGGELLPVMWNFKCPDFFAQAYYAVRKAVSNSKVTGVFIPETKKLGIPKTGEWTHMSVDVPKKIIYKNRLKTAFQESAEKKEDFKMLIRALQNYKLSTVETAVNILRSNSLYRGEKTLGIAEWFLEVKILFETHKRPSSVNITNLIWVKVATAPTGFCHISSSMIGTLLDDIEYGYDFDEIKRRFDEKMNPTKYQRPQAAPSVGNVRRAEEIIAKLGLENSLKRRFARLEELQLVWRPTSEYSKDISTGVFAGIRTKESHNKPNDLHIPISITMTWEKFQRTVLPTAKKIELAVMRQRNSYASIVTAEDPTAPPIIQWDMEEVRNPLNWYLYNGGSDPIYWGLKSGGYVEVTGITLQPNMYTPGFDHHGKGVMFVLKDCKDKNNKSSALFPETLKGELREVRSVMEEYSRTHKLSGFEEASACGLLLQETNRGDWDCMLKVTTDVGISTYKLDRWD